MAPAAFGMLSGLRSLLLSFARFLAHEAITAVKNFFFEWSSAHGVQEACVVGLFVSETYTKALALVKKVKD